jgi:hypothetical protein
VSYPEGVIEGINISEELIGLLYGQPLKIILKYQLPMDYSRMFCFRIIKLSKKMAVPTLK